VKFGRYVKCSKRVKKAQLKQGWRATAVQYVYRDLWEI